MRPTLHVPIAAMAALSIFAGAFVACSEDDAIPDAAANRPDGAALPIDGSVTPVDGSVPPVDSAMPTEGGSVPKILTLSTGHNRLYGVTFDPAGNIFAVGVGAPGNTASTDFAATLVKLTPSGALDTTFGAQGVATRNVSTGANGELFRGVVVQSTGKIVIAGQVDHTALVPGADARDRDLAVLRFNADGSPDNTFGNGGLIVLDISDGEAFGDAGDGGTTSFVADAHWGLARFSDDKLILSGAMKSPGRTDTDYVVLKLNADGTPDTTFGANADGLVRTDNGTPNASARSVTILADNSVIGAGYMTDPSGVNVPFVYKLTPAGLPDMTFGVNGVFTGIIAGLGAQAESYAAVAQGNKLVTTGYGRNATSDLTDWVSLRLTSDGQLDPTYGTGGVAKVDEATQADNSRWVMVLPDERVLLIGQLKANATNMNAAMALLTKDGVLDTSFGTGGKKIFDLGGNSDFFWSAAFSPDKSKIAVVGIASVAVDGGHDNAAVYVFPTPK